MNKASVQILDEMVFNDEAKRLLYALGVDGMLVLSLAKKCAPSGDKLLNDVTTAVMEHLGPQLNMMRWAMASADVTTAGQEEIVNRAARRVAAIALGMLDKLERGEAIDDTLMPSPITDALKHAKANSASN